MKAKNLNVNNMKESTDNGVDFEMQELLNAENSRKRKWITHSQNWFPAGFENPFIGTEEEYYAMRKKFEGMEDIFKITGCQDYPIETKLKMNFESPMHEYLWNKTQRDKEMLRNEYNNLKG
jgi:hypothetical protein